MVEGRMKDDEIRSNRALCIGRRRWVWCEAAHHVLRVNFLALLPQVKQDGHAAVAVTAGASAGERGRRVGSWCGSGQQRREWRRCGGGFD